MIGGLFGTDGVRGRAGVPPLDSGSVLRLGRAIGEWASASASSENARVMLGLDTRASGPALEAALTAGLASAGCDVWQLGVTTTPAVAHATASEGAVAGVVISASHNPHYDNGIKIFGQNGFKLEATTELAIANLFVDGKSEAKPHRWGRVVTADLSETYLSSLLKDQGDVSRRLEGMSIVFDGANGAGSILGPRLLRAAGARVHAVHVSPDGQNINEACGALHPDRLGEDVLRHGADLGVALDGDGDRCILVDDKGTVRDGDPVLAIWARDLHMRGALPGEGVVTTVMSNLGLELWLRELGLSMIRTPVGDKYVARELRARGMRLGGEQSGHILDLGYSTTGDGLLTALSVARIMTRAGRTLSELCVGFQSYPQVLHNVLVRGRTPLDSLPSVQAAIRDAEAQLGDTGRVLVRYSGTELKARVMIEGAERGEIETLATAIGDVIVSEIGVGA